MISAVLIAFTTLWLNDTLGGFIAAFGVLASGGFWLLVCLALAASVEAAREARDEATEARERIETIQHELARRLPIK